jgi:hypothetical protein
MSVNLDDLTDTLIARMSPPGTDLYPNSTPSQWFDRLVLSFWEVRLHGMLDTYEEDAASRGGPESFGEGIVTPINAPEGYDGGGGSFSTDPSWPDLSRDLQQLVVLWAAWQVTLVQFQNVKAAFTAKAGPVEYSESTSATILKGVLDALKEDIDRILYNLSSFGLSQNVQEFDAFIERDYNQHTGDAWWVR